MNGREFVTRVSKLGRRKGIAVGFDPTRGKGQPRHALLRRSSHNREGSKATSWSQWCATAASACSAACCSTPLKCAATLASTDGETLAEALPEAHDCLDEALAGRIVRQEPIPVPSPARRRHMAVPSAVIATKTALYEALRRKGLSEAAFARVMRIHAGDAPDAGPRALHQHRQLGESLDPVRQALDRYCRVSALSAALPNPYGAARNIRWARRCPCTAHRSPVGNPKARSDRTGEGDAPSSSRGPSSPLGTPLLTAAWLHRFVIRLPNGRCATEGGQPDSLRYGSLNVGTENARTVRNANPQIQPVGPAAHQRLTSCTIPTA